MQVSSHLFKAIIHIIKNQHCCGDLVQLIIFLPSELIVRGDNNISFWSFEDNRILCNTSNKFLFTIHFIITYHDPLWIIFQAIMGGTIKVPTLTGDVVLKVCWIIWTFFFDKILLTIFFVAGSPRYSTWSKSCFEGKRYEELHLKYTFFSSQTQYQKENLWNHGLSFLSRIYQLLWWFSIIHCPGIKTRNSGFGNQYVHFSVSIPT